MFSSFYFTSFFSKFVPYFRKLKLSYSMSSMHWRKSHFQRYAIDSLNINKSEVGQYVYGTWPAPDLFYGIWQGYIGVLEIFMLYQLRSCILCLLLGSCKLMSLPILIVAVTSHYIRIFVEISLQATGMHLQVQNY